jgi:general secretion pathway protein C
MTSRLTAVLVWSLAGAAAVFWALRLWVTPVPVPAQAQLAAANTALVGDLSRLLGAAPVALVDAPPVAPDAASRFRLTGVVATSAGRQGNSPGAPGLALISFDGKPVKAYRVGDAFDDKLSLRAVGLRSARIGPMDGGAGFVLDLPPPAAAATGVPGNPGGLDAPPSGAGFSPAMPLSPDMPPPGLVPNQTLPPMVPGAPGMPGSAQDNRLRLQAQ